MPLTYETYKTEPMSLTMEEMASLHSELAGEVGNIGDDTVTDLYNDLLFAAVRYLESRAHWPLWTKEEKTANDSDRTRRHNSAIDKLNILARYLKSQGEAASWREALGDEKENPVIRKRIGDFVCYIAFIGSLNAR
jgi:hypothetical protein